MKQSYDVILHIPSLGGGGAERVALDIARHFVAEKKTIALFIYRNGSAYELPAGVDVIVSRSNGHIGRVLEFRALLRNVEVQTVVSFLPYANLVSLLANLWVRQRPRLVVSEHLSSVELGHPSLNERIKFALLTLLYKRSDCIVAVSEGIAADLRMRLGKAISHKIVVIYNPCHITEIYDSRPSGDAQNQTILAVGRLVPQKGFDTLISAFRDVRQEVADARLTILGEGPERLKLEALVAQYGLQESITLPGFSRDIAGAYQCADLFVCSSRAEGFGNVIVEALSFGLPVVSTACRHGPEEILEGGRYGTLVPVGDERALADAIVAALRTTVDSRRQIARSRDFSLDIIGDRYMKVAGFNA